MIVDTLTSSILPSARLLSRNEQAQSEARHYRPLRNVERGRQRRVNNEDGINSVYTAQYASIGCAILPTPSRKLKSVFK